MPFRAFLGQPLALYAHHTDLKDGSTYSQIAQTMSSSRRQFVAVAGNIATDVFSAYRFGEAWVTLHSQKRASRFGCVSMPVSSALAASL